MNDPQREKTLFSTCAPYEDLNQLAHPRSLITVFVYDFKNVFTFILPTVTGGLPYGGRKKSPHKSS